MKFRKMDIVVEAFQYDGDLQDKDGYYYVPAWAVEAFDKAVLFYDSEDGGPPCELYVETLEGRMHADVGDWIIKGIKNELYPCKPDIFTATYELVEDSK